MTENTIQKTHTTHGPEETQKVALQMLESLAAKESDRGNATIVALRGDLGAGKTVFVKGVAEALGVKEVVTSPTFVIAKWYTLSEGMPWKRLVHIDAYRLEGEGDLEAIDWAHIATDPGNLVLLEWPEQVGLGVPERAYHIDFEEVDEETRKLHIPC